MNRTIQINGVAVATTDENNRVTNIQFLPDNELAAVLEQGSKTCGQLQLLRNASFDYTANKPRVRANSELIRKAAHGKLSSTRDKAFQLTLKSFVAEGIDWQRAFVTETVDIIADLMGPERMRSILKELIVKL